MAVLNTMLGLFLIGLGFLVKASPDLISGYNTMSKENKKKVDIVGLSTFLRNGFITIGLIIIVGYWFFKLIGLSMISNSLTPISILVGVLILAIYPNRFDHNEAKKSKLPVIIVLSTSVIFVLCLFIYGFLPAKIIVQNNNLQITGMYGFEMKSSDISGVELTNKLPSILIRTNGFSAGASKKGSFKLDRYGKCKLFLNSNKSPFLIITNSHGEKIITNDKDTTVTKESFNNIKALINK
jgi:hypothetical protein